jgi:uncharacterized protein DUF3179
MHPGATLGRIRLDRRIAAALLALVLPACTGMFTPATTVMTPKGPVTAVLGDADEFPRFTMPEDGERVSASTIADDDELLVLDHFGQSRALLVSQMSWHHVAEGTIAGHPVAVAYCVVCDSGVGLLPMVDGRRLHVSAGGLSNGVVMLRDDETGSYWNSLTGEAQIGPLSGKSMEIFGLKRMRAGEARATRPDLVVLRAPTSAYGRVWSTLVNSLTRTPEGYMPSFFRKSFDKEREDPRRRELELGLGVVSGGKARFYPASELAKRESPFVDELGGTAIVVDHDAHGLGHVEPIGQADAPFEVWGRWYGFSSSFPACDVWTAPTLASGPAPALLDSPADRSMAMLRAPCESR